jgi:hypothetical protein
MSGDDVAAGEWEFTASELQDVNRIVNRMNIDSFFIKTPLKI